MRYPHNWYRLHNEDIPVALATLAPVLLVHLSMNAAIVLLIGLERHRQPAWTDAWADIPCPQGRQPFATRTATIRIGMLEGPISSNLVYRRILR